MAGKDLWGEASVSLQSIESGTPAATITGGGSNTITLELDSPVQLDPNTPTPFCVVVPAGAFENGFSARINTFYGTGTRATSKNVAISRSRIRSMAKCSVGTLEVAEFNLENPAVAEYLAKTTATLSGAQGNYGQSFFDQTRNYRPDQPNTKTIFFTDGSSASSTVVMSENMDMSNPVLSETVSLRNGSGSYTLRNMVPGRTYYYNVTDGSTLLTAGAFKATGQLRMIAVENGFNIRDLGGWTGLEGNRVRYELLYRGGSLGGSDKDGRTSDIPEADRAELKRGKHVYFNCRQGADRTGTVAFIIEGLLGCYGDDNGRQIGMDYELTGFSQANLVDNSKVSTSYRGAHEAATGGDLKTIAESRKNVVSYAN